MRNSNVTACLNAMFDAGFPALLLGLSLASFATTTANAQSIAARLSGAVSDSSKAAIPGATVTASNSATGLKTMATTTSEGLFLIYPLMPGVYDVTISASGMQTAVIERLQFYANDHISRDIQLQVAPISQAVTVTTAALTLNTTPSVESTVTEHQVEMLPLNGRDYTQLIFLGAGAIDSTVTGTSYDLGGIAVNGNRAYSNSYSLDGVGNSSTWQNTAAVGVSLNLVREFKVVSGVAPAEYGQAGTNVTVISKSGANGFHGTAFEYYRGNTLIANDPFASGPPAAYRRNQFGASLGGPVQLPSYDGRNRTFFFLNYEGGRTNGGATRVATVPPDEFWKGDLSSLLPRVQLRDPLASGRPVIPNNRLDQYLGGTRVEPVALKLRPVFATATKPGLVNNVASPVNATTSSNQISAKLDQVLPRGNQLSLRFTDSPGNAYNPGAMGLPGLGSTNPSRAMNGMIAWTALLGSRTVSEFRAGASAYGRKVLYTHDTYPTAESAGMLGMEAVTPAMPPFPALTFTGVDAFTLVTSNASTGGQSITDYVNNVYTVSESISATRRAHQLKAGLEWRRADVNAIIVNGGQGGLTFSGSASSAISTGYSFADYLIGLPASSYNYPSRSKAYLQSPDAAFFVQDDWRVSRRLTLMLGFRNESPRNPLEKYNRYSLFTPDLQGGGFIVACNNGQLAPGLFNPGVVQKLSGATGKLPFLVACADSVGYDSRRLIAAPFWKPSPRVGFTWDPLGNGKWLVRSGYGIFYSRYPEYYYLLTTSNNVPFASQFYYYTAITNLTSNVTLKNPFPSGGTTTIVPYGIDKDSRLPDNQQWNFTLVRSLGSDVLATLAYIGNKGTHLFNNVNLNGIQVDPVTGKTFRTYQSTPFGTGVINMEQTRANSTYHAMQAEIRRRYAHGISYQVNWTWAKGIDNVAQYATVSGVDVRNVGRDRANSDYVRRHVINANFTWEVPVGSRARFASTMPGWLNAAVGGWSLSGIYRYYTGRYLTPAFNYTSANNLSNRPDVVYGVSPNLPRDQRSRDHWFNINAFTSPPPQDPATKELRFGNAGRNSIVGPGINLVNGSLNKSFRVPGEGRRLVVRLDMFNIANHPNWANPDTNISNVNTAAHISAINGTMRQAQFAVEFHF